LGNLNDKIMANKLDLALAQLVGFHHGKWNRSDIIGLITGMGLTKGEWIKIKKQDLPTYLTEAEVQEIDEYFKL
jgi:hypothetical protein